MIKTLALAGHVTNLINCGINIIKSDECYFRELSIKNWGLLCVTFKMVAQVCVFYFDFQKRFSRCMKAEFWETHKYCTEDLPDIASPVSESRLFKKI